MAAAPAKPFHLCFIAGARPNFVKIAPLLRAVERAAASDRMPRLRAHLIHTGQHYDSRMSDIFFQELEIPAPEANLNVGSNTHAKQTAAVMVAFEEYCEHSRPDMVVVVGDVNSTLACSLVAAKMGIPLAHVEAGLRSFDPRMPEEVNRIVTDRLSNLLFVSEESGAQNLLKEGVDKNKIHFVGNVMVDTLFHSLKRLEKQPEMPLPATNYGLITLHRPSNVDDRNTLTRLVLLLKELSSDLPLLFPIHPRTAARLNDFSLRDHFHWYDKVEPLGCAGGLHAVPSLSYMEFLCLMRHASVLLTDSGGIQEETTALGVPCITLRENTERPITVEMGTNCLAGTDEQLIRSAFMKVAGGHGKKKQLPPLWDGHTAERIIDVIAGVAEKTAAK